MVCASCHLNCHVTISLLNTISAIRVHDGAMDTNTSDFPGLETYEKGRSRPSDPVSRFLRGSPRLDNPSYSASCRSEIDLHK